MTLRATDGALSRDMQRRRTGKRRGASRRAGGAAAEFGGQRARLPAGPARRSHGHGVLAGPLLSRLRARRRLRAANIVSY